MKVGVKKAKLGTGREAPLPGGTPTGKTRTFDVVVITHSKVVLDESVIAQGLLPDGYILGPNPTEAAVIEHLAFNLIKNGLPLSDIDGYANCPNDSARVTAAVTFVEVGNVK
jgi:hypothetical protein